jgi:hypothetical protein
MPLVFVHGVGAREWLPRYTRMRARRNECFQRYLRAIALEGRTLEIFNPYWGEEAARFERDASRRLEKSHRGPAGEDTFLLDVCRGEGLARAAELLVMLGGTTLVDPPDDPDTLVPGLTGLADALRAHAASERGTSWLETVHSDEALIDRLQEEVERIDGRETAVERAHRGVVPDDVWDRIDEARRRLTSLPAQWLRNAAMSKWGKPATDQAAYFAGDIFVYLLRRGTPERPGPIIDCVLDDLKRALESKATTGERLVVIGHSLGGVIACDLFSHFARDIEVDVLFTVGSTVAMFEELKILAADVAASAGEARRARKPDRVKRWINVYDPRDLLGYEARSGFDGVEDIEYETAGSIASTHSAYFEHASFYEGLNALIEGRTPGPCWKVPG